MLDNKNLYRFYEFVLLLFWTTWFNWAIFTNFSSLCAAHNVWNQLWLFNSHNYSTLQTIMSIYNFNDGIVKIIFISGLLYEVLIFLLFFLALFGAITKNTYKDYVLHSAFILLAVLWLFFILLDEVFKYYKYEVPHIMFFLFTITSFASIKIFYKILVKET